MTDLQRPDPVDDPKASPTRQGIQSVELAMIVLQAMENGLGPMSLSQMAAASGNP